MMRRTARQLQFRSYKGIPFFLRILLNDSVVAAILSLPLKFTTLLEIRPGRWPFREA